MPKFAKILAVILIMVSLAAAVYQDQFRFQAEQSYKEVQLLVDYDELCVLSAQADLSIEKTAELMREKGATGILIRERTLNDLRQAGSINILNSGELSLLKKIDSTFLAEWTAVLPAKENTLILTEKKALAETIYQELAAAGKNPAKLRSGAVNILEVYLTAKDIDKLGVGFDDDELKSIGVSGLSIIPRLREQSKNSDAALMQLEEKLKKIPALGMITFNDQTLPGAHNLPLLSEKLTTVGVPVGMFEFYNQNGLNSIARLLNKNVVRIHSISETEMLKYDEDKALDRYMLAVTERNIRAIYVHFFGLEESGTALVRALAFTEELRAAIEEEGLIVGGPQQLPGLPSSRAVFGVIGLGVVGGAILLGGFFLRGSRPLILGALVLLGWIGLLWFEPLLARKGFALLAVLIFPVLSVILFVRRKRRSLSQALLSLLFMSAVSFLGALIMSGLLAEKSFMLTLDVFSGVKLAHIIPLFIIALYFLFKDEDKLSMMHYLLENTVKNKHLLIGAVLAGALVFYVLRTGNQAPQLVSSWETSLREALDQLLGVRPRTKEFLLGHPAMLVLLYYGYEHRKLALLVLAVIGQVSLINTYAHIHTPLMISFTRSLHGLWIGILIGIVAIICLNYLHKLLLAKGVLNDE